MGAKCYMPITWSMRAKMPVYLSLSVTSAHQPGQTNNCQFFTVYMCNVDACTVGRSEVGWKQSYMYNLLWQTLHNDQQLYLAMQWSIQPHTQAFVNLVGGGVRESSCLILFAASLLHLEGERIVGVIGYPCLWGLWRPSTTCTRLA